MSDSDELWMKNDFVPFFCDQSGQLQDWHIFTINLKELNCKKDALTLIERN